MPRKPSLSHCLRDARIRRGLSVAEVAEQVGVSTASNGAKAPLTACLERVEYTAWFYPYGRN